MNDDDDDNEDTTGHNALECQCVICTLRRQADAMGAANQRRGLWIDVFMVWTKTGVIPSIAANYARESVKELDKAFPEVKAAAMKEDR